MKATREQIEKTRQEEKRGAKARESNILWLSRELFNRIVDMRNTLPLPVRQATTISSFKKGVREFLAGNV